MVVRSLRAIVSEALGPLPPLALLQTKPRASRMQVLHPELHAGAACEVEAANMNKGHEVAGLESARVNSFSAKLGVFRPRNKTSFY